MTLLLFVAVLVFSLSAPAFCSSPSAAILARCRAEIAQREAVMMRLDGDSNFLVVAARDHKLEGTVVQLRHILTNADVYLYYKPGQQKAVLRLPPETIVFSQEEIFALKNYYAARRAQVVAYSTQARPLSRSGATTK
jgi:mRNA-degrading endonuclease YafQ of YafQ-DinJ toxin-antitoxin module